MQDISRGGKVANLNFRGRFNWFRFWFDIPFSFIFSLDLHVHVLLFLFSLPVLYRGSSKQLACNFRWLK